MSRYENDLGDTTLSVGWDHPLNTFFAQVYVNQDEDDLRDLPLRIWIGQEKNEVTELELFESLLKNEGYVLPPKLLSALRIDQDNGNSSGDRRSQANLAAAAEITALLKNDGWKTKI